MTASPDRWHGIARDYTAEDVRKAAATVLRADNRTVGIRSPVAPPAARLPPTMLPVTFTATDCQRLMDCPYRFFAARGLGLAPEDEVREEIDEHPSQYIVHCHGASVAVVAS